MKCDHCGQEHDTVCPCTISVAKVDEQIVPTPKGPAVMRNVAIWPTTVYLCQGCNIEHLMYECKAQAPMTLIDFMKWMKRSVPETEPKRIVS